ncbi:response regulator transcription factor [Chitinimonas sp. BJB300]|uniref:response regulator transcription factor n=1 Tax=Chitinimonas sp. BJB300 TaxID=1559339 RepID=UPI000C110D5E|nr:response regulator [Chitinimonas sp. BJB300]PHV12336.1 DNA-binding response regulator [Chitinimonas sp. BJB300]TSJ90957.1 response regulator transcription factor [Chitinimonas sp. BJB300]
MLSDPRIALVDDDAAVRDALKWLFASRGHQLASFESAAALLADRDASRFGCLVLDLRMPGMGGLELFQTLSTRGYCPPTVFLTGHGDVPQAVAALKQGAVDFIEKPFDDNALVSLVENCLALDGDRRKSYERQRQIERRLAELTPREREVMALFLEGKLNKQIADTLDISMKTVEVHRARVLEKMGVKSAVELANLLKEMG